MLQKKVLRLYVGLLSCFLSTFLGGHGFIEGTLVTTPNGVMPIEQLQKDDLVISRDKTNGTFVSKPIQSCEKHTVPEIIELFIEDTSLLADPGQRFFVLAERKWYAAKDLKPGQILSKKGGGFATVSRVKKRKKAANIYDLSIQDCHNFCVSGQEIIAHNYGFVPPLLYSAYSYCAGVVTATAATVAEGFVFAPLTASVATAATVARVTGITFTCGLVAGVGKSVFEGLGSWFSRSSKKQAQIIPPVFVETKPVISIKDRFASKDPQAFIYSNAGVSDPKYAPVGNPGPNPVKEMIDRWISNYDQLSPKQKELAVLKAQYLQQEADSIAASFNVTKAPIDLQTLPPKNITPPPPNNVSIPIINNIVAALSNNSSTTNTSSSPAPPAETPHISKHKPKINQPDYGENTAPKPWPASHNKSSKGHKKIKFVTTVNPDARRMVRSNERIKVDITNQVPASTGSFSCYINPSDTSAITEKQDVPPLPKHITVNFSPGNNSTHKTRFGPGPHPDKEKSVEFKKPITCAAGAGGMPPDEQWNQHNLNNPNDKSGPKIKPKTEPKWEKPYIPQATNFVDVQTEVVSKFLSDVDKSTAAPYVCTHDPKKAKNVCCDKIAGVQWHEGKVVLRVDFDEAKGAHFNLSDCRSGKKVKLAIPLEGGEAAVVEFLVLLNNPETIAAALEMYEKKVANEAFGDVHPGKLGQYGEWIRLLKKALGKNTIDN